MRRLQRSSARPASQRKGKRLSLLFLKVLKLDRVVEDRKEVAKQALRLGSHEVELNRIDTAFVAAAKAGTCLPAAANIFRALTDASIACAEVIDTYEARPIPTNVRTGLSRLHCAITDLAASLKLYAALSASKTLQ
jgi:hypothetical protein